MTKKISICMIVKDEEKNLRRCLDSLKPLLEKEYAELIIVDTGSTDDTIAIAKEYTERLYLHQWNGSFSSMRNISISYATGEWIFIVDADEELETPSDLLKLIDSTELQQYNTVQIKEKNLVSLKTQKIIHHVQERLFRNDGTFKYEGSVHNQPVFKGPVLTADIWLLHYGYVNEDKELMNKKFERTATILKRELEKDPDNIYYRFQLSRSYAMKHDFLSAYEEIKQTYNRMMKKSRAIIMSNYFVFGEYARICYNINKYDESIQICDKGLQYKQKYLDLYFFKGHAHLYLNHIEEGVAALDEYIKLAYKYLNSELELNNQDAIELYSMDSMSYDSSLERIISTIYNKGSQNELSSFIKEHYDQFIELVSNNNLKYYLVIKAAFNLLEYEGLYEKYIHLTNEQKYLFTVQLEKIKKELGKDIQLNIEEVFSKADNNYGQLNKVRSCNDKNKLILEFLNKYNFDYLSDDLVIELAQYFIDSGDIKKLFKKLKSPTIKNIVKYLIDNNEKKSFFIKMLESEFRFSEFQNNRVYIAISNVLLLSAIEETENKEDVYYELKDIFIHYLSKGIEYIEYLYSVERIRLTYNTLANEEEKFFSILYLANFSLEKRDMRSYQKYILEATNEYPYLASLLKSYVAEQKYLM